MAAPAPAGTAAERRYSPARRSVRAGLHRPGLSGGTSEAAGGYPRGSRDEPATLSTQHVSLEDHDGVGPLQGML